VSLRPNLAMGEPAPRILVADDDGGVRRSIAMSLSRGGFDVTAVEDGAPAIAHADAERFELVVVDLHMPTNGLAVVSHYKRCYGSRVYCAVLSGEDDDVTRAACREAGADEMFAKPIPASVLRQRLADAVVALRAANVTHERSA
jgi:DNA-binding response OmpR family regulator